MEILVGELRGERAEEMECRTQKLE